MKIKLKCVSTHLFVFCNNLETMEKSSFVDKVGMCLYFIVVVFLFVCLFFVFSSRVRVVFGIYIYHACFQ